MYPPAFFLFSPLSKAFEFRPERVFASGGGRLCERGKAMAVSQEKLDRRHQMLRWIYTQGDAKDSAELVWVLQRVLDELQRLNEGSQGQQRLHRLLGTVIH